ncbi:MAG: chloride channel protein [Pirellulaceae bacterium]|nr:chloride channel protein [Pirellulaceae bacterium]
MKRELLRTIADHFRSIFDTEVSGRLIWISPLLGVIAGLGGAAFFALLDLTQSFVLGRGMGYYPPSAGAETASHAPQLPVVWWAVVLIPVIGGLLCGLLVYSFAPEAEGHGTDAMVRAFHRLGGRIRTRVPFVKALASIITIGTGGSAGREGPIAQIGAGLGSMVSDRLRLGERDRRLLMLSGAAAGIGAIFRAPLGGALFVSEVLYGSTALEFAAVIPAFIASITGYTTFSLIFGRAVVFETPPDLVFTNLTELPFYLAFAFVCALVGYVYVAVFYGLRNRVFRKLPIPKYLKPAVGGLVLGLIALQLPHVMSGGYGWIQQAIDGQLTVGLLVLLCFGKIVATSFTISSGGSGGVFAPSLFIGAMLGGAFGQLCHQFFPETITHPEAFVLVGMGGFFAGVARVPLTAMLMVCEMSGSYDLLIPLMLVSIVNVAVLSSRWSLYEEQVPAMVDSPAHQGDFVVDVLEQIRVREVMNTHRQMDLIPDDMPLPEILRRAADTENTYFPVVDRDRRLVGIFSLRDLRTVLTGDRAGSLVLATDIATTPVLTVSPDDDLHVALRRFTRKNIDELPVLDPEQPGRILGMLRRKEVIAAYHQRVTQLRQPSESVSGSGSR